MATELKQEFPQLRIIRPLGPQGPKIGVEVLDQESLKRLREGLAELTDSVGTAAILNKLKEMGFERIDF